MFPDEVKQKWKDEENKNRSVDVFANISTSLIDNYIINSNLTALKVIFYLSKASVTTESVIKNDNHHLHKFKIDTLDMCNFCNIPKNTLKSNITKMMKTTISKVDDIEKSIEYVQLLPRVKFVPGKNQIDISIFDDIYKMCKDVAKRYANVNLENLMSFENKHSIRMMSKLEDIKNYHKMVNKKRVELPKRITMDLKTLNGFFGTNYKRLGQLEQTILIPVKDELDKKSFLSFIYQINYEKEKISSGRPKAISITIDLVDRKGIQKVLF